MTDEEKHRIIKQNQEKVTKYIEQYHREFAERADRVRRDPKEVQKLQQEMLEKGIKKEK